MSAAPGVQVVCVVTARLRNSGRFRATVRIAQFVFRGFELECLLARVPRDRSNARRGNPLQRRFLGGRLVQRQTPTLRDVARTAPNMHDGRLTTLEDVLEFYSKGGRLNRNLDTDLRPANFTPDEKAALVANVVKFRPARRSEWSSDRISCPSDRALGSDRRST